MQIRDPIHGAIELVGAEIPIIDHPLFQRLRTVRQLGFSELAFPGATHTRLSHGLGALHLATRAFESVFRDFVFERPEARARLRQAVRLAALLHDIGHPPLSHCCEVAMPQLSSLDMGCYGAAARGADRQAKHEDISVLLLTASKLTEVLAEVGHGLTGRHVAALVSAEVEIDDDVFVDGRRDLRPVLSQIISSECDVDRMDYLARDSYFAGVEYGRFDRDWLLACLSHHVTADGKVHLALDDRALYAFDHFLIARYHMFLMVYYHYRSVVFEEMLRRYLETCAGEYQLPSVGDAYAVVDDTQLMAALRASSNPWARRIVQRRPYSLLLEWHGPPARVELGPARQRLVAAGIDHIAVASRGVLSKYVGKARSQRAPAIYVVDRGSGSLSAPPRTLDQATDLFARYGQERQIARIYVERDSKPEARSLVADCVPVS